MKKKTIENIKDIGGFVIQLGIGTIVTDIVVNATSEEEGKIKKICIFAGTVALAGMVAKKVNNYFRETVDEISGVVGTTEVKEDEPKKEK